LSMDAWTTSLLTNAEVLAVNQHSRENNPVINTDRTAVWTARPDDDAGYYVAVFNIGDMEQTVKYAWKDLDIPEGPYAVRDLWEGQKLKEMQGLQVKLAPHASVLYRVTRAR